MAIPLESDIVVSKYTYPPETAGATWHEGAWYTFIWQGPPGGTVAASKEIVRAAIDRGLARWPWPRTNRLLLGTLALEFVGEDADTYFFKRAPEGEEIGGGGAVRAPQPEEALTEPSDTRLDRWSLLWD
jgi:hypothetical protein